jgi:hypothetical protein
MRMETESEPPSCPPVYMIGQDSRGNWVVRDQSGLRGGLFVGRAEALRYIRDEPAIIQGRLLWSAKLSSSTRAG